MKTFAPHPDLQQFHAACGQGDGLFYMGHASVLCRFSGRKIVFDPVVLSRPYGDSWAFFPPQVTDPSVFEVDAVVVSHIHQDHYDLQYLKALDGRAKTIVVGGRPSLLKDLQENGVKNLQIVEPERVTEILPGVFMYGVLHESNGIDSSAIVFNDRFCIYHGNDNYLQPDSLRKFTRVGHPIDVACIPYAYIHWYPFLLECEPQEAASLASEGERLVQLYMDDCLSATRILQPRVVIPFGANLLLNHGGAYSPINLSVKTPVEFCEYTQHAAPDLVDVVRPMLAGDYCNRAAGGELDLHVKSTVDGKTYREQAARFLDSVSAAGTGTICPPLNKTAFLHMLNDRLAGSESREPHQIRVDLEYLGETMRLEIDCARCTARWVDRFTEGADYHHFKLDPLSSGIWLNGGRMEEVIGTRRFTLKRVPNVHSRSILRLVSTVF